MAHDVPQTTHKHFGRISLPEYLDYNRSGNGWGENITAYHITKKRNLESILKNGLLASSQTQGVKIERPEAVYLFCSRSVVLENIKHLIDEGEEVVILDVVIPASKTSKLYADNIYNMSIPSAYMSAMQYRDNIPANWIKSTFIPAIAKAEGN